MEKSEKEILQISFWISFLVFDLKHLIVSEHKSNCWQSTWTLQFIVKIGRALFEAALGCQHHRFLLVFAAVSL